ncbi:uncharacterized protein LOC106660771 isoform X2 [Cimex lectularius]|uniref:PHD finger protein 3 n=1 Tax=Cimex lectularius TaxID=79782 RepID=A0A8I6R8C0_CIMLE|nr:uncharacterized protein LOC106660771 isoform X2 [Cimex lectularius]
MSSTFVADSTEDKDDSLIIIVNPDGTITVDPETLQKLIANQHGNVSVVRVDGEGNASSEEQADTDASHVNLTVEGFYSNPPQETTVLSEVPVENDTGNNDVVVDPFSEMEPEHIARLESALQSDQAKEILGHKLGDNLTEMLDILERSDEKDTPSLPGPQIIPQQQAADHPPLETIVHNDHSYHLYQPQPSVQVMPPSILSRPLMRGGRARVRGTGRILTRGGITRAPVIAAQSQPTSQPTMVVAAPKVTKSIICNQSGRLVQQPAVLVASDIKVQKKIIATKVPTTQSGILSSTPRILTQSAVTSDTAVVRTPSELQKKSLVRGGKVTIRTPKSKRVTTTIITPGLTPSQDNEAEKLKQQLEDEIIEVHSPIPKIDPTIPQVVTILKKKPSVVVQKLSPKVVEASLNRNNVVSKTKPKEVIKYDSKTPGKGETLVPTLPNTPNSLITSPTATAKVVKSSDVDDTKKKKERGKWSAQAMPVVLGPELFSTPDIIRRVSTEKASVIETPPTETQLHLPAGTPLSEMVVEKPSNTSKGEPESLKVQVQPLHPPIVSAKCEEMSAESLLDSIHAEVAKDESRFLAEALLFDELTNDEDAMGSIKMIDCQIEETLKKMEIGQDQPPLASSGAMITPGQEGKQTDEISTSSLPTLRKLPPIELPATRSATKKAAAAKVQDSQQPREVHKQETRRASVDSKKSNVEKKNLLKSKESDGEDDQDSDDESWNSEDDPDRLWCICKKPHNNRFMICCDSCEEWFHGKCVGITKSLGQQMEQQGVEWSCPTCKETKLKHIQKSNQEVTPLQKVDSKPQGEEQPITTIECIVCKKMAKDNNNFCSDICIKKHVLMMLAMLKRETVGLNPATKVVVYEKKTGRLLSGEKAPSVVNLADWLISHKTFEVVKPSILPLNKYYKTAVANKVSTVEMPNKTQTPSKPQLTQNTDPSPVKTSSPLATKQATVEKHPFSVKLLQPVTKTSSSQKLVSSQKNVATPLKNIHTNQKNLQTSQKSIQNASKAAQLSPKAVQPNPKSVVPIPKVIPSSPKIIQPCQKTVQIIQAQPHTPLTTVKAKAEDSEKTKKKTQATSVTPILDKKKEDKSEAKLVKKDKKSSSQSESKSSCSTPTVKQEETPKQQPEPIRANVKRTLHELLQQRVKQDPELNILTDEIKELVTSIEEELFNLFKDTGAKYKAKYRSLVFNIKDAKNLTLYRKIVEKSVSPSQLVRLSPEELASQELAQWREKEAKHQIEIIKKNELDLIYQAKTVVLKSRKGEEVIESKNHEANITELESALNRTADDYEIESAKQEKKDGETALLNVNLSTSVEKKKKEEKKDDRKKDKRRDRKRSHRSRSRSGHRSRSKESRSSQSKSKEINKTDSKEKSRSKSRDESKRSRSRSKERSKSRDVKRTDSKSNSDKIPLNIKKDDDPPLPPYCDTKIDMERSLTPPPLTENQLKEDDLSDREPSSTVTINTPPYIEDKPPFWSGILNMSEVTKLYTSAYEVSGSCEGLDIELLSNLECVGRIQPDAVWDYVSRMKKAGTKDIVVIRFQSESEEEKMNYLSLYSYLNSRNRMAVIGAISKTVKDFYVLPLASHSPIPQVLLPLDGPGFDDYRPHLLLGIIIRTKKGNTSLSLPSIIHKKKSVCQSKIGERSYTPPLPDGTTTPPLPPTSALKRLPLRGLTPPLPDLDDEPYSPGEDDPYSPEDMEAESIIVKPNPEIQRNLEEVNRMIEEKRQKIEIMTSAASLPPNVIPGITDSAYTMDDENDAYSPSARFTPPTTSDSIPFFDSKTLPDIKLPSNLQEILASIKVPDSLNGQSRVLDVNSDPIVRAYTSAAYRDEDDDHSEDELSGPIQEKTSRDPRQRPIILPKSSLSQLSDADLIRKAAEMEQTHKPEMFFPLLPLLPPPPFPTQQIPFPKGPPPALTTVQPIPNLTHPQRKRKEYSPTKEFDVHKNFKEYLHKDDYMSERRNRKWEHRGPNNVPRGVPPRIHNRGGSSGGGSSGTNFRRGFDQRGRLGQFRGRFGQRRGGSNGSSFRGPHQRHKFDGVQNEWDEEIRNFEQRKAREMDRERRKRRPSRSPSPNRRRRQRKISASNSN